MRKRPILWLGAICMALAIISTSVSVAYFTLTKPYNWEQKHEDIAIKEYESKSRKWNEIPVWAIVRRNWAQYLLIRKWANEHADSNICTAKLVSEYYYEEGVNTLVHWLDDSVIFYPGGGSGSRRPLGDIKRIASRLDSLRRIIRSQTSITGVPRWDSTFDKPYGDGLQVTACDQGDVKQYNLPFHSIIRLKGIDTDSIFLDSLVVFLDSLSSMASTMDRWDRYKKYKNINTGDSNRLIDSILKGGGKS